MQLCVADLRFLRGDLWVRYALGLFLIMAVLLCLFKVTERAPSWLGHHDDVVHHTTFLNGLAVSLLMLITGILWGFSIAVTLASIALVIILVFSFLSDA